MYSVPTGNREREGQQLQFAQNGQLTVLPNQIRSRGQMAKSDIKLKRKCRLKQEKKVDRV